MRRTIRKERRYGGAERAWDVRAELPILWRWVEELVYARCRVMEGGGGLYTLLLLWGERRGES